MNALIGITIFVACLVVWCASRVRTQGLSWATAKRWLLYIPIALFAIAACMGFFFYADHLGVSDDVTVKWFNAVMTAIFVCGLTVKKFWQYRRAWKLWIGLSGLVVAHFVLVQTLRWQKPNYFWMLVVIGLPEMLIAAILLTVLLKINPAFLYEDHT